MSIETIFPTVALVPTEEELLITAYANPVVQKHLRILAMHENKELLVLSSVTQSDALIAKAHAKIQGKLEIIATLLSIAVFKPKE